MTPWAHGVPTHRFEVREVTLCRRRRAPFAIARASPVALLCEGLARCSGALSLGKRAARERDPVATRRQDLRARQAHAAVGPSNNYVTSGRRGQARKESG